MLISPSALPASADSPKGVYVKENFNDLVLGEKPVNSFSVKTSGNGNMVIAPNPDEKNKSLLMSAAGDGESLIETVISDTQNEPVVVSFRFKAQDINSGLSFLYASGDNKLFSPFEFDGSNIIHEGKSIAECLNNKWYYCEFLLNFSKGTYNLFLDGSKIIKNAAMTLSAADKIVFKLSDAAGYLYLDDIYIRNSGAGGDEGEYFENSTLFLKPIYKSEADDIVADSLLMYRNTSRALKFGTEFSGASAPKELDGTMYVPLRLAGEALGAEVTWNTDEAAAFAIYKDKTVKVKAGEKSVIINGSETPLLHVIKFEGGSVYISADDIAAILGETVYIDDGLIIFGDGGEYYVMSEDAVKNEVKNTVKYERPAGKDVIASVVARHPDNGHPRLAATKEKIEYVKEIIKTDDFARELYASLEKQADEILEKPLVSFLLNSNANMVSADEDIWKRMNILGLVWHVSGNDKYADRAWQELNAIINFPTWNELVTFLDTGQCMYGASLGYDWFYDYLSAEQRAALKKGIIDLGLEPAKKAYTGVYTIDSNKYSCFWISDPFNWNMIGNEGVLAACLAFCEEEPSYTAPLIGYALRSLEIHFNEWEPDGAWQEGPDYGFSTLNGDANIIEMFCNALSNTFGYTQIDGFSKAAYFPAYMLSSGGLFNFSDANPQSKPDYYFSFLFADLLNDSNLAARRKADIISKNYSARPCDLLWYNAALSSGEIKKYDLDKYFRKVETTVSRSDWSGDGIFAGFHSGPVNINHSHLDSGSFVYDYAGKRWFHDMPHDPASYYTAQYTCYTNRAEGHNTLVIDETPYNLAEQNSDGLLVYQKTIDCNEYSVGDTPSGDYGVSPATNGKITVQEENDKNKYILIESSTTNSTGGGYLNWEIPSPYAANEFELDFRFKMPDMSAFKVNEWRPLEIGLDPANKSDRWFPLYVTNGGLFSVDDGEVIHLKRMDVGSWHSVRLAIHPLLNTLDVYVDGEKLANGFKISKPVVNAVWLCRFTFSGGATTVGFDDIAIYVGKDDAEITKGKARRYDQVLTGDSKITRYESKDSGSIAVTDLTTAYSNNAESAVRGIMMTAGRNTVLIRDEVKLKKKCDVYWFAHYKASDNAVISEEKRSAIISNEDKRVWVGIISEGNYGFEIMDARPLPYSPDPENQSKNEDWKKLAIKAAGVNGFDVEVAIIPLLPGEDTPLEIPKSMPIKSWSLADTVSPRLNTLMLKGTEISGFDPEKKMYFVKVDNENEIPAVEASAANANVSVTNAAKAPGYTLVNVSNQNGSAKYFVCFNPKNVLRSKIQGYDITAEDITVSDRENEDHDGKHTIDGNLSTRWTTAGKGNWIIYDFKKQCTFNKLEIAWFYGVGRKYQFIIELSDDMINWKTVFTGNSSGTSDGFEEYKFDETAGRYLKIICNCYGEANEYNNIAEVR